jgi:hypothetical protein
VKHCCRGKAINNIYWSVCACVRACMHVDTQVRGRVHAHIALLIQNATRMRHIVMSLVAPQSPLHFSKLPHKRCDFRKKKKVFEDKCAF